MKFENDDKETETLISTLKHFNDHYEMYSDKKSTDYAGDYIIKKFKEMKEMYPEAFI